MMRERTCHSAVKPEARPESQLSSEGSEMILRSRTWGGEAFYSSTPNPAAGVCSCVFVYNGVCFCGVCVTGDSCVGEGERAAASLHSQLLWGRNHRPHY